MMLGQKAKTDHLRNVPMFAGLNNRQLTAIAKVADEVEFPEGRTVASEGELGKELFLIVDGSARVVRNKRKVADLGPGDVFGEMSVLDHQPRSASVVTTAPTRALVVPGRALVPLLEEVPRLAETLLKTLSSRLREANTKLHG